MKITQEWAYRVEKSLYVVHVFVHLNFFQEILAFLVQFGHSDSGSGGPSSSFFSLIFSLVSFRCDRSWPTSGRP